MYHGKSKGIPFMNTRMADYNQKIAVNREKYRKSIDDTHKNYKRHLENYRDVNKKRRAKNVRLFKNELDNNGKILQDRIKKINKETLKALDRRDEQYSKKLDKFKTQIYEDRIKKKKEFNNQLDRISESFRGSLKSHKVRNEDVQNEIRNRLNSIIDRNRQTQHKDISNQREIFKEKTRDQQDNFTNQTRNMARKHQVMEADSLYQQEKEDQERRIRYNNKLADYRKAHKNEVDTLRNSLSRVSKNIQIKDNRPFKNIRNNYDKRIQDINRHLDGQIFKMRKAHDREIELTNEQNRKDKLLNTRAYEKKVDMGAIKEEWDQKQGVRLNRLRDHILNQESKFVKNKQQADKGHKVSIKGQKRVLNNILNEKEKHYENLLGKIDIRNRNQQIQKDESFKNKIKETKNTHVNEINLLEQNNKSILRNERRVHGEIVNRLNEKNIKQLDDIRMEFSTDKNRMMKEVDKELYYIAKTGREEFANKINKIITMYEESLQNKEMEMKNTVRQYENKLRRIKKKFELEIRTINGTQREFRKMENEQNKNALKEIRDGLQAKINKMRQENSDTIKNIKNQHAIDMTHMVQQNRNDKISLEFKHNKEIKTKVFNLRKSYDQNIRSNQQLREDLAKSYEERLENLKKTLKRHYQLQSIRQNEQIHAA